MKNKTDGKSTWINKLLNYDRYNIIDKNIHKMLMLYCINYFKLKIGV